MTKTRFLTFSVILLALLNVAVLVVVALRPAVAAPPVHPPMGPHGHHEGPHSPKQVIIERLQFNEDQVARYEELVREHRENIREKQRSMNAVKADLYATLAQSDSTAATPLIQDIQAIQGEIERIHYQHFAAVRSLCTPEQHADFDRLSRDLARIFAPPHHRKHRPHPGPPRW
ncbi:MAG: periplasmic heavy metal sensor [Bacteroidota bacterium]